MFEEYATAAGPSSVIGLDLHTVWHVLADSQYDINLDRSIQTSRQIHTHGGTGLIALKSIAGRGCIRFRNRGDIVLTGDSLVLFDWQQLQRYRCLDSSWHFWWFEFNAYGPADFRLYVPMAILPLPDEPGRFRLISSLLRKHSQSSRRMASALFLQTLYEWLAGESGNDATERHFDAIDQVIDLMYSRFNPPMTIEQMAGMAGLSVRHFRNLFQKATGESPKKYYNQVRLTLGRELLRQRQFTITQIASRLGFSSPYHFSREYKRLFGISPSQTNPHHN